jgi:hypothetical protein
LHALRRVNGGFFHGSVRRALGRIVGLLNLFFQEVVQRGPQRGDGCQLLNVIQVGETAMCRMSAAN